MARIRSIHPGLFTDEVFMAASASARILMIGLWTEADDQGVFEWKPLTLKARLLPADAVDTAAVLQELTEAQVIRRFEHDGKPFGAIRNFRKFQRPQKPKNKHHLPDAMRSYVGLSDSEPIPVQDKDDTEPGKSPQMEEEGGRMEENPTVVQSFISKPEEPKRSESRVKADPLASYSETELKGFAFEFAGLDVPSAIRELAAWCDRKGITDPIERKNMIYGGMQTRHAKAQLSDAMQSPVPAVASPQLARSRLTQKDIPPAFRVGSPEHAAALAQSRTKAA